MRLGEHLVSKGIITADQLDVALIEQRLKDKPLGEIITTLGFVSQSVMRDSVAETIGRESADLLNAVPDQEAIKFIDKSIAVRYNVVPVSFDETTDTLELAISDVYDIVVLDRIQGALPSHINLEPVLATDAEIRQVIDQFYGYELSVNGILKELETGKVDYKRLDATGEEYSKPIIRLVDAILSDAVKSEASDIHFEPELGFLRIRYRIDGALKQVRSLHKDFWSPMSVRLKVMADLNIAETRAPQDGRISLTVGGKTIDFRVSVQPVTYGENVVLRVLDRSKGVQPLENLDIFPDTLDTLKLMMSRPEGIILVTGPTGSGKTTTLYSMLNHRNSIDVNIMTLEDPVEYPMNLIRQTSISEVAKMDFASGIRSLMRQDPDIILVGEIRDEDTAEMAFRAAMTGHQVFSTLHTNSALGAIPRLLNIGVKADILSGNIIGIIGQRLVKRLCRFCRTSRPAGIYEKIVLGIDPDKRATVYDKHGCNHCNHTGHKGRISILEVLRMDEGIDALIAEGSKQIDILEYAKSQGYQTMLEDGTRRVLSGDTTISDLARAVDLAARIR